MDAHVDQVEYLDAEQRVRLSWKQKGNAAASYQNATFDYAVIAMPFSKVKLWRLPSKSPHFSPPPHLYHCSQVHFLGIF